MLLHKPLATFAAFVRFDPGMDSFVDVLLLVRREALIAERARILKKGKYFRIAIEELGLRPIPPSIWRQLPSFHHNGLAHARHEYVALRMSSRKQYIGRAFPMSECASEKRIQD